MWKAIVTFFQRLFRKKPTPPPPAPTPTPTFQDNFANLNNWTVSNWSAPSSSVANNGTFATGNASIVNGMLCLQLTQTEANGVATSVGGEITTKQSFGYGTYEFVVKASSDSPNPSIAGSPISGSITGCFSYGPNSVTEIDVEVEGVLARSALVQFTSWHLVTNPNEYTTFTPTVPPQAEFHTYKYVWSASSIEFYVDGVLVSTHTSVIPTTPCPFIFNHYGTNNVNWGGLATPNVTRYMFVKSFKFTAA